jgi:hypothetical protein
MPAEGMRAGVRTMVHLTNEVCGETPTRVSPANPAAVEPQAHAWLYKMATDSRCSKRDTDRLRMTFAVLKPFC